MMFYKILWDVLYFPLKCSLVPAQLLCSCLMQPGLNHIIKHIEPWTYVCLFSLVFNELQWFIHPNPATRVLCVLHSLPALVVLGQLRTAACSAAAEAGALLLCKTGTGLGWGGTRIPVGAAGARLSVVDSARVGAEGLGIVANRERILRDKGKSLMLSPAKTSFQFRMTETIKNSMMSSHITWMLSKSSH